MFTVFDFIQFVMEKGYVDEHGHRLYGAAAISHLANLPISKLDPCSIERGKQFVEMILNK